MKKVMAMALTVAMILGVTSGCKKKLPKFELEVGDTIEFGTYEDEPIEWEVKHRKFVVGENKVIVEFQSTFLCDREAADTIGRCGCELVDRRLVKIFSNCFDERLPEETNRRIVDHIADVRATRRGFDAPPSNVELAIAPYVWYMMQ